MGSKIPNPAPRPDQLWPEGVPHPTSPPPPRVGAELSRRLRRFVARLASSGPDNVIVRNKVAFCRLAAKMQEAEQATRDLCGRLPSDLADGEQSESPAPTPASKGQE